MPIRVLDPTLEEPALASGPAPRLPSLEGRTVGLLDNSKVNVRELLDLLESILKERYGVASVVRLRKSDPSRPAPPDVAALFANVDALVSAVGD